MTVFFLILAAIYIVVMSLALYPLYVTGRQQIACALTVLCAFPVFALYGYIGAPRLVPVVSEYNARLAELREIIKVTEGLIKQNPNNIEAWMTQAQAFADSGDYKAASNSYKQAVLLSKGNPTLIMAYAETLIMLNEGVVDVNAKKSIDIALMIDSTLPVARYYKAIWLLQNEQPEEAMQMMKNLYAELPDDSALKRRINEQIGR